MISHAYFRVIKDQFFEGDKVRAWRWFKIPNASLGDSPINMILKGREKKLVKFIDEAVKRGYL